MNFLPSKFTTFAFFALVWLLAFPSESFGGALEKNRETKTSKSRTLDAARKTSREAKSINDHNAKNRRAGLTKKEKEAEARRRRDVDQRALAKTSQKKGSKDPQVLVSARRNKGAANEASARPINRRTSSEQSARETASRSRLSNRQQKEALHRAEAQRAQVARGAAITQQKSKDQSLRDYAQAMIAKDDLNGEDPEVRQVAINALGNRAGTVVVMDPKTGRVFSIVNQEWGVREGFKPCSTIKLVTGLAGLNEQVINPNDTGKISDSSNVSLTTALAYSKNGYFQEVGGQVGFDKMVSYARQLGLGEKTGINMRNEFAGYVPGAGARSGIARISSHGDNFQVTPLQLATLVSAIGNGGKLVAPFVIRSRQDELKFRTKVRRQIPIAPEAWRNMIPGMVGAVNYGSGWKAHDPGQTVAGKTGTCIEDGGWVGLFTSYAPLANPTLAVVVIARGADARGHIPAAIAGRIYRDLSGRFGTSANLQIASTRKSFTQDSGVSRVEQSRAAVPNISEPDRNEMGNRTPLVAPRDRSDQSQVKRVLMQIPTRTPPSARPQIDNPEPVLTITDGLTRPRRVSSL